MFSSARRNLIGLSALAMIVGAVVCWIWPPGERFQAIESALMRGGALLAVVWLAYEEVMRLPRWLLLVVPPSLLVVVVRPRWFLAIIPIIVILAMLKPRLGRKQPPSGKAGE